MTMLVPSAHKRGINANKYARAAVSMKPIEKPRVYVRGSFRKVPGRSVESYYFLCQLIFRHGSEAAKSNI